MNISGIPEQVIQCRECQERLPLDLLQIAERGGFSCHNCGRSYSLTTDLQDQITRFQELCKALCRSKDLIGRASLAVQVGEEEVSIPLQLLLTRLPLRLELEIEGERHILNCLAEPNTDDIMS